MLNETTGADKEEKKPREAGVANRENTTGNVGVVNTESITEEYDEEARGIAEVGGLEKGLGKSTEAVPLVVEKAVENVEAQEGDVVSKEEASTTEDVQEKGEEVQGVQMGGMEKAQTDNETTGADDKENTGQGGIEGESADPADAVHKKKKKSKNKKKAQKDPAPVFLAPEFLSLLW